MRTDARGLTSRALRLAQYLFVGTNLLWFHRIYAELYHKAFFDDILEPKRYDTCIPILHVLDFDNL